MDTLTAAPLLGALSHADRLATFRLLVQCGPVGLCSGEIAERQAIAPTRMSFHLGALERVGLIAARREGRRIRYAARYDTMRDVLAFLTEDCCNGEPAICSDLGRFAEPSLNRLASPRWAESGA